MQNASIDPRAKIFAVIFAVLILGAGAFIFFGENGEVSGKGGSAKLSIAETDYDFGDISMKNGLARHEFKIKNDGDQALEITDISTSCACTKVVLVVDGRRSPEFSMPGHGVKPLFWSEKIAPGQSAVLEAVFDPLAHGPDAVGPITRVINIISNTGGKGNAKSVITFSGNVIK
ncbi:MAG: DUF1573 domain-containing protein [Candidatus Paceibacterota bacterium]|jgi:hypothetical protein